MTLTRCLLFRVGDRVKGRDDFDEGNLHVALWHEDVLRLHELGLVAGANGITPQAWAEHRTEELRDLFVRHQDGHLVPVPVPSVDGWENQERTIAMIASDGLVVTEAGHRRLQALMVDRGHDIAAEVRTRVEPMLLAGRYDTAVRDACLLVEHRLKELTQTQLYGSRLVERFFADLLASGHYISAQMKTFRTEVRAIFKFM
jgi:hypothetical protein